MSQRIRRVIEIDVTAVKAQRDLDKIAKASEKTEKTVGGLKRQTDLLGTAFRTLLGFNIVSKFTNLADSALDLEARLGAVAGKTVGIEKAWKDLLDLGNRLGVGISELGASYTKLGVAVPTAEHNELVQALDVMGTTLATTGASTQQVNAVLLQMSQALGSGALQGDEFRAVFENAPVLLRAWQKAAGLTDRSLRDLSASASLTTDSFFKNLDAIQKIAKEMVGLEKPPLTIARAFTTLKNEFVTFVHEAESINVVLRTVAESITLVAENLDIFLSILALAGGLAFLGFLGKMARGLKDAVGSLKKAKDAAEGLKGSLKSIGVIGATQAVGAAVGIGFLTGKGISDWIDKIRDAKSEVENTTATIHNLDKIVGDAFSSDDVVNIAIYKKQLESLETALQTTVEFGRSWLGVMESKAEYKENAKNLGLVRAALDLINDALDDASAKAGENDKAMAVLNKVYEESAAKLSLANLELAAFAAGGAEALKAFKDTQLYIKDYNSALDKAREKNKNLTEEHYNQAAAAAENARKSRGAAEALKELETNADDAKDAVKDLANKLDELDSGAVSGLVDAAIESGLISAGNEGAKDYITEIRRVGKEFEDVQERIRGLTEEQFKLIQKAYALKGVELKNIQDYLTYSGKVRDVELQKLEIQYSNKQSIEEKAELEKAAAEARRKADQDARKALQEQNRLEKEQEKLSNATLKAKEKLIGVYEKLRDKAKPLEALDIERNRLIAEATAGAQLLGVSQEELSVVTQHLNKTFDEQKTKLEFAGSIYQKLGMEVKSASDYFTDFAKSISDKLGSAFKDVFDGTINTTKDFFRRLSDIFKTSLAQIAAQVLKNQIIIPIVAAGYNAVTGGGATAGGGTTPAVGTTGTTGSGSSILSKLSSFTGTSVGTSLGQSFASIATSAGFMNSTTAAMAGALVATPSWAFGVGGAIGTVVGTSLFKGGQSQLGAGIGAAVGTVAGSALSSVAAGAVMGSAAGPVGAIVGGVVGGIVGAFGGSLVGGGGQDQPAAAIGINKGRLSVTGYQGLDQEQGLALLNNLDRLNEALAQLAAVMGPEAQQARREIRGGYGLTPGPLLEDTIERAFLQIVEKMSATLGGLAEDVWKESGGNLDVFVSSMQNIAAATQQLGFAMEIITPESVKNTEQLYAIMEKVGLEGIPALVNGLTGFMQLKTSFVTDAEILERITSQVDDVFAQLGRDTPQTVEAMRAYIDSLDMNKESHREIAQILGENAEVVKAYTDSIGDSTEYRNMEVELLKLEGKEIEALALEREIELEALDQGLHILKERIWALEDEQSAITAVIAELDQYINALQNINDMLSRTRETIFEFGKSEEEIYKLRKEEADNLVLALADMTDATQIQETVAQINQLINSGWGILDESQKGKLQDPMLEYLDEVAVLATERLSLGLSDITSSSGMSSELDATVGRFSSSVSDMHTNFSIFSEKQLEAAKEMKDAARLFIEASKIQAASTTVRRNSGGEVS